MGKDDFRKRIKVPVKLKPQKKIRFELCSDDPRAVSFASKWGYKRIELCSGITLGGLTPGPGLTRACVQKGIEIHTLLRHRPGDFYYDDHDLQIYLDDMVSFKELGVAGIVVGCLEKDGSIQKNFCERIAQKARELHLDFSFHRAFDFVADPFDSLETLIDLGFKRILSSGAKNTALEGKLNLQKLVDKARGRIEIMAGSGVNEKNAREIAESGVNALHYTAHFSAEKVNLGMGTHLKTDFQKIIRIPALF